MNKVKKKAKPGKQPINWLNTQRHLLNELVFFETDLVSGPDLALESGGGQHRSLNLTPGLFAWSLQVLPRVLGGFSFGFSGFVPQSKGWLVF